MDAAIRPRRGLPPGRSLDGVRNHYAVESAIAAKLMAAPRDERSQIYRTMYDELFTLVPDHPRLLRRDDATLTALHNVHNGWQGAQSQLITPSTW